MLSFRSSLQRAELIARSLICMPNGAAYIHAHIVRREFSFDKAKNLRRKCSIKSWKQRHWESRPFVFPVVCLWGERARLSGRILWKKAHRHVYIDLKMEGTYLSDFSTDKESSFPACVNLSVIHSSVPLSSTDGLSIVGSSMSRSMVLVILASSFSVSAIPFCKKCSAAVVLMIKIDYVWSRDRRLFRHFRPSYTTRWSSSALYIYLT